MSKQLELNDPVFVTGKGGAKKLEGVVAFLGKVDFADGDDWVGVRLTGSSVGQGKNDGSVKDKQYFTCSGPNGGLFVRKTQVTKRVLSKLEELRLRRELASQESGGADAPAAAVTPRSKSPKRPDAKSTGTASAGGPKSKSRLEELRQRRAALTTSAAESSAASTPQQQKQKLEQKIQEQDEQISSLQEELQQLKHQQTLDAEQIQQLKSDLEQKEEELKNQPPPPEPEEKPAEGGGEEVEKYKEQVTTLQEELKESKALAEKLTQDYKVQQNQHTDALSKKDVLIASIQAELRTLSDTSSATQQRDASQYKELAKSQAEFSAMKRKYEQVVEEKQQLDSNVEDLTLDKEQLMEEKDAFEERLEELKIDVETAQMECEELRMELENARSATASALQQQAAASTGGDAASSTNDDMAHALATQNARLREALIRLREQSSQEKMELIRQLKMAEKAEDAAKKLQPQLDNMKVNQQSMEEQMEDLKDMVEQGAAFEGMVEDLSDRLLSLEEDNSQLRITIRELEEAQELTTEMEEVQAEELKALNLDLENRDSVIRNLEEAIKMQRKREDDFIRTVGNYRTMTETLKQEKEALLELQHGGEGERSSLIASSQKALARAAQLVSDAADMRKREAQAVMERIDGQIQYHLAVRYERMLPRSVASQELSAIKGELMASKVASMASHSLNGISLSFTKSLRLIPIIVNTTTGEEGSSEEAAAEGGEQQQISIQLSDESKQEISTMVHQSECAHVLIDTSIDLLRLLLAGHWPDLLSEQGSTELGILLGHSISELDLTLRNLLKSLKEEGVLSPHQTSSSLVELKQTLSNTLLNLQTDMKESDHVNIPSDWNPPGLQLFQTACYAKFTCLGVVSVVTTVAKDINENNTNDSNTNNKLRSLLVKLGHLGNEANNAFAKLSYIDAQNTSVVAKLSDCVMVWKKAADELFDIIKGTFSSPSTATTTTEISLESVVACEKSTDNVLRVATQFSSALRSGMTNTPPESTTQQHPLSPETDDFWFGVSKLVQTIRKTDGDEEDVNFLFRARAIEHRLTDALDKEPKLSLANAKVTSLEKSLATRSKEIAMQNARLSELEKLLAKTSSRPASATTKKSATLKSSEELNSLREENRVLMEAMDVLQRQVDEYENEIRVLNSMKTPKKGSRVARRSVAVVSEFSARASGAGSGSGPGGSGVGGSGSSSSPYDQGDQQTISASSAAIGALEAALFRPALNSALRDAARWKGKALTESLLQLPPLSVPVISEIQERQRENESKEQDDYDDSMGFSKLSNALSDFRMEQASIQIVGLGSGNKTSRTLLRESKAGGTVAAQKLDEAAAYVKRSFMNQYGDAAVPAVTTPAGDDDNLLVGKLKLGDEPYRNVSTTVCIEDLARLQMHVVQ